MNLLRTRTFSSIPTSGVWIFQSIHILTNTLLFDFLIIAILVSVSIMSFFFFWMKYSWHTTLRSISGVHTAIWLFCKCSYHLSPCNAIRLLLILPLTYSFYNWKFVPLNPLHLFHSCPFVVKGNPRSQDTFCYLVFLISFNLEQCLGLLLTCMILMFLKSTGQFFARMSFNLCLSDVSSGFDLDYAFLTGIPQKWLCSSRLSRSSKYWLIAKLLVLALIVWSRWCLPGFSIVKVLFSLCN